MALKGILLLLTITTCVMARSVFSARQFVPLIPGFNLQARLEANGNTLDCWTALTEIRLCSNEIIAYFMNGAIDISTTCCQAISLITHQCWPAMLSTLGFTPDETFILRGYCDASGSSSAKTGPVPSPLV
ncbi:Egg cell-secreted protein 1.4 [Forsythia ovata]|uniref:Egg cell-secreted protein 1.4 n=1 Tax=Forsythia ovata TaxID=205694 RepID=A0ABD1WPJ6_9LAMI